MTRIGVFGSAFNPPHLGHLVLVAEARWQLGLDRVIVVPTGDPYHKETADLAVRAVRLEMAEAAFRTEAWVEVSDLEVGRAGPSRTCDTLDSILASCPETELTLLLGADAALGLPSWHRPDRVTATARIGVVLRDGIEGSRIEQAVREAGGTGGPHFFRMPEMAISSTLIRDRIRSNTPYRHLVPAAVARIIDNERLYAA